MCSWLVISLEGGFMITQINISWNKEYEYDGLLYFAQRIVEMLDYTTVDIYRAPLLNTSRLIDEYLKISHGEAKSYHLEEVYNEFSDSFKKDIVIQYKLGEARIQQIINRLNKSIDKRQQTMEYLCHTVSDRYLAWSKEYIEFIVPKNNEKRKIERAIRCFIPELLRCGYSRDDIYHSARQLLTEDINPDNALSEFLQQFDLKTKTYAVYLGLSDKMQVFKDILTERLDICFDDDGNFDKVDIWRGYHVIKISDIKTLDASGAANKAFEQVELFTTFYQYFGNYSGKLIQNRALTISEDGCERKLVVNRGKYKSIEDENPPKIGEISEMVITSLLYGARCSMSQLKKITKLHNNAISGNGLENGFLNLWSIMEMICISNPETSKIEQVKTVAVPILKREYFPTLLNDITENLQRILPQDEYTSLIKGITDGNTDNQKVACLILLPKYSKKLDSFVDCLINYPVIRTRMLNLHDDCKTRNKLNNLTEHYAQRVSWHLYRIYRARNSIVHSGKRPSDLQDLGEHLHSYVDSLVDEVVIKLSTSRLCHLSNVFVESELKQQLYDEYFKKVEPIDTDGIKLIFSKLDSWTDC